MIIRKAFLPFSPPNVGEEEIREVADTLRSEWITTGPKTARFQEDFRSAVGAPAALAVNSCTAALHLSLVTLGVGPGDEVITTPLTFASTVNVIEHVGARPVLADVEPDTLNLDPAMVVERVTSRTKAMIPVHYAGHPVDLDAFRTVAADHGLGLIEDAAHALPARYRGRLIGSSGNPTAFSFYATKNMTTGEGGMLTGDEDLVEKARTLGLHGLSKEAWSRYEEGGDWYYEIVSPGFKYNMSDIQASLGIHQLRRLGAFHERRRQIVDAYREAFAGDDALELPVERPEVEHAWHLFVLRLRPEALTIDRDRFVEEMRKRRIGTSVHFIPIHLHPFYRDKYGYAPHDFPVAYANYARMLSLPLHPGLRDEDVRDVIEAVRDILGGHRR